MANDLSNLPAGKSLQNGKYKIIKVLGQGGYGITYLASTKIEQGRTKHKIFYAIMFMWLIVICLYL